METAGVQSYSVRYASYEFNLNQKQTSINNGPMAKSVNTSEFIASMTEFRLDIQYKAEPQFQNQGGIQQFFQNKDFDFSELEHNGKPILEMSPEEAGELVSADGYWGVTKTAERLAAFILNGAGDNLEKLQAGREGIIRGFKEAEQIWGGQLPGISYETLENALGQIDERISELGGAIVDINA